MEDKAYLNEDVFLADDICLDKKESAFTIALIL